MTDPTTDGRMAKWKTKWNRRWAAAFTDTDESLFLAETDGIITTLQTECNEARARVEELEGGLGKISYALKCLFAMVNGEVPSLLEDDHHWDMCKEALELADRLARGETKQGRGS